MSKPIFPHLVLRINSYNFYDLLTKGTRLLRKNGYKRDILSVFAIELTIACSQKRKQPVVDMLNTWFVVDFQQ